ncbi:MAG: hypothetical protein ABIQ95_13730 [Bdellovibrionia bacterium]
MKEKFKEFWEKLSQAVGEQQWAQELKGKWEELDLQSKLYLKLAAVGSGVFLIFFAIFSSVWSVHKLKQELTEKRTLLTMIQNSTDELRRLQDSLPASALKGGAKDTGPWSAYFETLAGLAGMDKSNLNISVEKPGTTGDLSKESLFDIDLKHVSVKQVINYAVSLENGQRPTKIRNLSIDTKGDPTGYMDATFAVSGFTIATVESK